MQFTENSCFDNLNMAQAAGHLRLTVQAQIRFQASACENCGGLSVIG